MIENKDIFKLPMKRFQQKGGDASKLVKENFSSFDSKELMQVSFFG